MFKKMGPAFATLLLGCTSGGLSATSSSHQETVVTPLSMCATDGSLEIDIYASGLDDWNGAEARIAAFEGTMSEGARRIVDVNGPVKDGSFDVTCAHAADPNNYYPSVALYLDANGSGRCDDGDVGELFQMYAWDAYTLTGIHLDPSNLATAVLPVAQLSVPLGVDGTAFCAAFPPDED